MIGCIVAGGCAWPEVVPDGGKVLMGTSASTIHDDEVAEVTVCGLDQDGFPVVEQTSFWVVAVGGSFAEKEGGCGTAVEGASVIVSEVAGDDGCVSQWLCPSPGPTTVQLTASSGTAAPATASITVDATVDEVVVYPSSAGPGPDGGSVEIFGAATSRFSSGVEGAILVFTTTSGSFPGGAVATTDAGGTASVMLELTTTAQVSARVIGDAENAAVSEVITIPVPGPAMSAVTPSAAVWEEDQRVVVRGTGFSASPLVQIGSLSAEVVLASETAVEVLLPEPIDPEDTPLDLQVVNPNGLEDVAVGAFTYLVVAP